MSKKIFFKAIPFEKKLVTLALESGVDAVVVEKKHVEDVRSLGRIEVLEPEDFVFVDIQDKKDEKQAVKLAKEGKQVVLLEHTEIIPIENILAQVKNIGKEVSSLSQAQTSLGILERGVEFLMVLPTASRDLKEIVRLAKLNQGKINLQLATIKKIEPIGLGHRVCVDTVSLLKTGQGMLVGNSSKFTFLVHAETESNPYVSPRPFRINAGGVHSYTFLPADKTAYLEELRPGNEVLIVNENGEQEIAVVGRIKTEIRPMLLIEAEVDGLSGCVILQNAETIRLVGPEGPISVVNLQVGDKVKAYLDSAGRHFGMKIKEEIIEK
ncbi:3-dehydroquinate synthase II [Desulfonauticus submarinus]|uniref:3-dehydroquinate synthase II n=1 Tax=Desulfonauticus submarinus TaxID=206665 RepID=A0A1H0BIS5_9BACT|nr:3-dehydroquinate synthase II [Desulfonauticus submarinus]SDN45550.1 3-dehydroquinate synthase II [Desulfonauticus submarinus]